MLWRRKDEGRTVLCDLCAHRCKVRDGQSGICRVRHNVSGTLVTSAFGRVVAAQVDPIEKKPFYHFLPGTWAFSVATAGCNLRCGFCQNWRISARPGKGALPAEVGSPMAPAAIVEAALESGCQSVAYTYTEPTIFFEYAYETARAATGAGLRNLFVTNGYMTREALETIAPYLDAANVDLKSFDDKRYRRTCGGRLAPVLESIRAMKELGIWLEVTTLLVPGESDDEQTLESVAGFLAELDPDLPWHVSRFHPSHEYHDRPATSPAAVERALEAGRRAGLRFVYPGNAPGLDLSTRCPACGATVIARRGPRPAVHAKDGACPECGRPLPGVLRRA